MNDSVVELSNVSRIYGEGDTAVSALQEVDLVIDHGDIVSIVGPSGSGKSTLLHVIGGLDLPTEGIVQVSGTVINELSVSDLSDLRLRKIGFVFQAYNLIPVLSARENVEFILQLQGVAPRDRRERATDVLTSLGLEEVINRRPDEMSGGQQQRVAIARAIVTNPELLLADEPSANLDSTTTQELCQLLQQINEEKGVTIVTATHDPVVMGYTRRRFEMLDGRLDVEVQP